MLQLKSGKDLCRGKLTVFRDRIVTWRRKVLLNRILVTQNRANRVRRRWPAEALKRTAVLACVAALGGYAAADAQQRPEIAQSDACIIKGNISDRGERIYHVPGGAFYGKTRISPAKGERWFCSEAEAREAGWRQSRR